MMERLAINGGDPSVKMPWPPWPILRPEDEEAVLGALRGTDRDCVKPGGIIGAFEEAFGSYQGRRFALACSSGTSALDLAVAIAGVLPGDEVIVPSYTWGSSVGCVLHNFAIPVFADIREDTFTIDPETIEPLITERTKAIVVVHLYGLPADMDPIMDIARRHGLVVIEDCAQAHGAEYKGRKVGSIGDIGCFSFQASKHVPALEGGMIVLDDEEMYQHALTLAVHPARQQVEVVEERWRRYIDSTAYTYRMHPLAAALAKARLPLLDQQNEERRRNVGMLLERIKELPGIRIPITPPDRKHTYHMVTLRYKSEELGGLPRSEFIKALNAEGVPAFTYIGTPIHLRPRFQDHYFFGPGYPWKAPFARYVEYKEGDCPVAERICREEEVNIFTGCLVGEKEELMEQVAKAFEKVVYWMKEG